MRIASDSQADRAGPGARVPALRGLLFLLALLSPAGALATATLYESEPNDTPAEANPFAGGGLLMGTLSGRDQDGFRWTVGDLDARRRWTLELKGVPGRMTVVDVYRLTFGVNGVEVTNAEKLFTLSSRSGERPVLAEDLLFEPAEYLLGVAHSGGGPGFRPPGADLGLGEALTAVGERQEGEVTTPVPGGYRLLVREGASLAVADRPAEGARPESAQPLRLDQAAAAYHPQPTAWYRIEITEEAQLWRFQVIGEGIEELAYHDGAGVQNQRLRPPPGQRRATLSNLYLMPGTHHISVRGKGAGAYRLLARPLGPPDPNGEVETNDEASRSQGLAFGQTRSGLLEDPADRDNYRFSLGHWDHIRLAVNPPNDGAVGMDLYWDEVEVKRLRDRAVGKPVTLQGLFPPGDYRLALAPRQASAAEYAVSLERLPRFGCAVDCEPNDNRAFASPLPADWVLAGWVGDWGDDDHFALPPLDSPTEVTIPAEGQNPVLALVTRASDESLLEWDNGARQWRGTIPADTPSFLRVRGRTQGYRFALELDGGGDPAVPRNPPVELALTLAAETVAAYREAGQRVGGELELANRGETPVDLALEAATSDHRWTVLLEQTAVQVPAGGTFRVPLSVFVAGGARADRAVRVSLVARSAGGQVETHADLAASAEAAPVSPYRHWALPERLRGGLNVAWQALGGRLAEEPVRARFLRFSARAPGDARVVAIPDAIEIWERPAGGGYRSILGEWGGASSAAVYEATAPMPAADSEVVTGDMAREEARELAPGRAAAGRVALGRSVHWYRVETPEGGNTLTLDLGGEPTVLTALSAETAAGEPLSLRPLPGEEAPHLERLQVQATPGETIYL